MIRALPLLLLVVIGFVLAGWLARWVQAANARRPGRRGSRRVGGYELEARSDQAKRRLKGVGGPVERRDEIVEFLDTHQGVEAYVEPKTVMSPKSVVLVDVGGGVASIRAQGRCVSTAAFRGTGRADLRRGVDRLPAADAKAPGRRRLGSQLEPGHPVELSTDPKQRLPKEEAIFDLDELVEDVADQPGALGVLVVDLQDVKPSGVKALRPSHVVKENVEYRPWRSG